MKEIEEKKDEIMFELSIDSPLARESVILS